MLDESGEERGRFVSVWNGVLHEFRNHLTVLLAATTELRGALPPTLARDLVAAIGETERNVQSLSSLLAQLDAAVSAGQSLISDLDEVIDRALRIAGPSLGRGVSIAVTKGRKTGVKNHGAALECLLSALIVELARAAESRSGEIRYPEVGVHVDASRTSLIVEIESNGARPQPGSWRLALANDLAAKLDATIGPHPEVPGFIVQFR